MSRHDDWYSLSPDERELLDILSYAHIQLDRRGYPRTPVVIEGADDGND